MSDTTSRTPIQMRPQSRAGIRCEACENWISSDTPDHDRELHQIVALERIAKALEVLAAVPEETL